MKNFGKYKTFCNHATVIESYFYNFAKQIAKLSKRIHLEQAPAEQQMLIGIASSERIWKLCWELNKELGISLKKEEIAPNFEQNKPVNDDEQALFSQHTLGNPFPVAFYEDTQSHPSMEFALFTPKVGLKALKGVAFIFMVRSTSMPAPAISKFLTALHQLPSVVSAVDISGIKNVNQIIP